MEHYPERGIEERYYEGENEWNRGRGQGYYGREESVRRFLVYRLPFSLAKIYSISCFTRRTE